MFKKNRYAKSKFNNEIRKERSKNLRIYGYYILTIYYSIIITLLRMKSSFLFILITSKNLNMD